jgi:hypothetical protein
MIPSITPSTQIPTVPQFLQNNVLRRQIYAELAEIRDLLPRYNDRLSQDIAVWHSNFDLSIHTNADEEPILQNYMRLLLEVLRDPISQRPLDENCLLGSDGYTYQRETLERFGEHSPAQLRNRSPLNVNDPTHLEVRAHPLVQHLLQWHRSRSGTAVAPSQQPAPLTHQERLQRIRDQQRARIEQRAQEEREIQERMMAGVNNAFAPLHAQHEQAQAALTRQLDAIDRVDEEPFYTFLDRQIEENAVQIEALREQTVAFGRQIESVNRDCLELQQMVNPLNHRARLQQIRDRQRARVEQRAQEEREIRERMIAGVNNAFAPLHAQQEQAAAALARQLDALDQTDKQRNQELLRAIAQPCDNPLQEGIKERLEILEEQIDEILERQIQEQEEQIREIRHKTAEMERQIQIVNHDCLEVQRMIIETKKMIKKQKKAQYKQLITTVAIIGASCFASWALQGAFKALGSSVTGSIQPHASGAELVLSSRF